MSKIILETRCSDSDVEYQHDVQLMELQKKLSSVKTERKKAEELIGCLENRMKLLKGEEIKALRKVAQTKNQTMNRTTMLEKLESTVNFRIKNQEIIDKKKILVRERNRTVKSENLNRIKDNKEIKIKRLQEDTGKRKEIQNTHSSIIREIKTARQNTNKSKSDIIRAFKQVSKDKREGFNSERKLKLRNIITDRYGKENKRKEEAEKTIQKLTDEETGLITKIKSTTKVYKTMEKNLALITSSRRRKSSV
eukprot:CAMPEP_0170521030 /NCGR_PEP_ID=MMETSP0209-20121228/6362_1 /TAXON_ID=665100 ORGANISM="Litonotus pictus, Strain P1" /NCGR_SAMPLE_ID=MMETSP0209 /ASSEMBLY_ACC=CAM_ASM_000301 /LENGTH=250 /DNA_ID=CAMNT_0010807673 /DNA_START=13 /DNA_END=765 /DNA_ORIENTATION=-